MFNYRVKPEKNRQRLVFVVLYLAYIKVIAKFLVLGLTKLGIEEVVGEPGSL